MTNKECAELLADRRRSFIEQTRMISHVVDKEFIDRVVEAYDRAVAALVAPAPPPTPEMSSGNPEI